MGKRPSKYIMGLPHNEQNPDGRDAILYGVATKLVIPVERGMPSFRTSNFDKENNEVELRLNLELLDKKRERTEVCQAAYKHQVLQLDGQAQVVLSR